MRNVVSSAVEHPTKPDEIPMATTTIAGIRKRADREVVMARAYVY
jgi:hypothetical protein